MNAQTSDPQALRIAVDARVMPTAGTGAARYAKTLGRMLARNNISAVAVTRGFLFWRKRHAVSQLFGVGDVPIARNVPSDSDIVLHPFSEAHCEAVIPHVSVIHSLAPLNFPDAEAEQNLAARTALRRAGQLAAAVIAPSQFTAGQIIARLGVPPERIHVVPYTCEDIFLRAAAPSPDPLEAYIANALRGRTFFLHVGATNGIRRNFQTLYHAWKRAFPQAEVALVTTAPVAVPEDGLITVLAPDDAMLAQLYRYALAVVVPTTASDFGLSMIEAFACGAPVIAAGAGALPATGGSAPYWINRADDELEWCRGLLRIAEDAELRAILRDLGRARLREFSAIANEAMTLEIFRTAARSAVRTPTPA